MTDEAGEARFERIKQANSLLRSDTFEAAWGRAVRDIYTSDVDVVKAMYDAGVEGFIAGFEYGQQS